MITGHRSIFPEMVRVMRKASKSKIVLGKGPLISGCSAGGCNLIRRRQILRNKSLKSFIITSLEIVSFSSVFCS